MSPRCARCGTCLASTSQPGPAPGCRGGCSNAVPGQAWWQIWVAEPAGASPAPVAPWGSAGAPAGRFWGCHVPGAALAPSQEEKEQSTDVPAPGNPPSSSRRRGGLRCPCEVPGRGTRALHPKDPLEPPSWRCPGFPGDAPGFLGSPRDWGSGNTPTPHRTCPCPESRGGCAVPRHLRPGEARQLPEGCVGPGWHGNGGPEGDAPVLG